MQDALTAIKGGRIPPPGSMLSFEEMKETLGFNSYYEEEKRYAISPAKSGLSRSCDLLPGSRPSNTFILQAKVIGPPSVSHMIAQTSSKLKALKTSYLRITGRDGFEKLDLRIPAGFLDGITNIVAALGGVNIKELLNNATEEMGGKLLLDFKDRMGDRIMVFLE
ncbi:hypothetical protein QQ045_032275 [Rhodiola kirilowii]